MTEEINKVKGERLAIRKAKILEPIKLYTFIKDYYGRHITDPDGFCTEFFGEDKIEEKIEMMISKGMVKLTYYSDELENDRNADFVASFMIMNSPLGKRAQYWDGRNALYVECPAFRTKEDKGIIEEKLCKYIEEEGIKNNAELVRTVTIDKFAQDLLDKGFLIMDEIQKPGYNIYFMEKEI